ncbi:treble-clef zinc-finger protein [Scopulibacillus darangshiensis]|uniref:Treble-clef zinc-finger protein n=1 Tax=Scopulibacillus darangshiensis TaxID=442528 RepID=A0A4R2P290_9BACL|nr:FusB/FusC family EF-G-binding protein [Scopulibacillus darangshiensis]TCP28839.1 treble-clef zinc-finger protein [Scopulibacillus darangshiensis]
MTEPFIRNHQYNHIKKQTQILQHAQTTVTDQKVIEAVRCSTEFEVIEAFPDATDNQMQILKGISELKTPEDCEEYLSSLEPYLMAFPHVTEKQIRKLFPKNKKLKMPNLSTLAGQSLTYLSWVDISTNKKFIIYELNGKIIGVEGRYTIANKDNTCSLCKGHGKVALFTAKSKSRPANSSPDYYKAVGNYMCVDSDECNEHITDVAYLEKFIRSVIGS